MKALVYTGPEAMSLRDVPTPHPGNDEVVVSVAAVGICGSDMHAYLGHDERRPAPLVLGHEAAGILIAGAALPPGERISGGRQESGLVLRGVRAAGTGNVLQQEQHRRAVLVLAPP